MSILFVALLLLDAAGVYAQRQPQPGPTLNRLLSTLRGADTTTLGAFWDSVSVRGTPFIDPLPDDTARVLAEFVYRSSSVRNVVLENGVNGWAYILNQLEHVEGTDIWHITVSVPANIRLGYVFRENDNLIPWHLEPNQGRRWATNRPDPFNPHVDSAQNLRSVLLGPHAAPDVWSVPRPGVPGGKVEELELKSEAFNIARKFSVYTPAGISTRNLPLLIVFDGPTYLRTVRLSTILDNLIADHAIQPVVVVFVTQTNRMVELAPNEAFSKFIASELIPFVRHRYELSGESRKTIVMGSSHGGLAAVWLARAHPGTIGNVISQSASLWWSPADEPEPEYLARAVAREPKTQTRFWLEVGSFEIDHANNGGPGQVDVSRHFRDVLVAKGYDVVFSEFPGGHEYQSWRVTAPAALRHFLPSTEH